MELLKDNALTIEKEFNWFLKVLDLRFKIYFEQQSDFQDITQIQPPDLTDDNSVYSQITKHYKFNFEERIVLIVALTPHLRPELLDSFFQKNATFERGYTEFGGVKGQNHGGFLPTGETIAFILSANNLTKRLNIQNLFNADHFFAKHNIIKLETSASNEPSLSGALIIEQDYLELLTYGKARKPNYNSNFPARLITTSLNWDDLILEANVVDQIQDVLGWINNKDKILYDWELENKLKPGYRTLFYGPPGTGKTFTACLLGKETQRDVYRIDLSMVVSKWVGETEKNLSRIFDLAEFKDWILFFDEADALFGKRSTANSSNDRYANQEVSYLLQKTEDYPGVVVLASNLKGNMDEAFTRRFQSSIYFAIPKQKERLKLWRNIFASKLALDKNIDFEKIANKYEITGGGIVNVLKYCAIKTAQKKSNIIDLEDIEEGIKKEIHKEGKTV